MFCESKHMAKAAFASAGPHSPDSMDTNGQRRLRQPRDKARSVQLHYLLGGVLVVKHICATVAQMMGAPATLASRFSKASKSFY
jgi:uroporphyrinogen-III decarboxylase